MDEQSSLPAVKKVVIELNRGSGITRLGIDLTKQEQDWLPDARNQRIEFTARIYKLKGGKWVFPGNPRKITFELTGVSKHKGVCMNFPRNGKETPDLFFADDDEKMSEFDFSDDKPGTECPTEILAADDNPAHSHHNLKAITKIEVTEATVVVRCEDYAASGLLKATAPDCDLIPPRDKDANPSEGTGENTVKIPWDDNNNDIPDSVAQDDSGGAPDRDEDSEPAGDGTPGDGLTNFEEYRGFIVLDGSDKVHLRTEIDKKDIFIWDRDNLGYGFFLESGLEPHFIPDADYFNGASRNRDGSPDAHTQVINFNRGHATKGEQHGLRLVNETIPGFDGYCFGDGPGLPRVTNRVGLNVNAITNGGIDSALDSCIAHELGHAINLFHHGDPQLHSHPDNEDTDPNGGTTSGDVTCIMRYHNYLDKWCHPDPPNAHCLHFKEMPEDVGTVYCESARGTGINDDPGHFRNDASEDRGDCLNRIRVKDWNPD